MIFINTKYFIICVLICLTAFGLQAQLITQGGQSPQALVQNILLGGGVTVSNIQYQGAGAAIGSFNGANCNIGLDAGIIMTTGTINNTSGGGIRYGPHGPNNFPNAGLDNSQAGYGLLTNLVGTQTYNATVLSFDFVPLSDYVEFRYVFASEEYPEYVGSQFNDVFGFFISGPGVGNNVNIAKVPGTNFPVAINNVHAGLNAQYFVNNGDGSTAPFNSNPSYVQYDGFTTVLTASSNVICGEKYRIIIAIADVQDGIFDSGIFLEANSFSSPVEVDISFQLSSMSFDNNYTMAEGCTSATVTVSRDQGSAASPLTIPITVSGTATMGLDYSIVPTSVSFAPGQTEVSFTLNAFADNLLEGIESIFIDFGIPDPCGNSDFIRIELAIADVQPVQVVIPDIDVLCPGQEVMVSANATGGGDGYNYLWNTGETTQSIFVSPAVSTQYTVTVSDNCLNQSASASGMVNVPVYDPLAVFAQTDFVSECPFVEHTYTAEAIDGAGDYAFIWRNANGLNIGSGPSVTVAPGVSTYYIVRAIDLCNNIAEDTVYYTITSPPLYPFVRIDTLICFGDSMYLEASGTGGFGEKTYFWPHSGETSPNIWVKPSQTTTYIVIIADECLTFTVKDSATVSVSRVIADFTATSNTFFEGLPVNFNNISQNATQYQWVFSTGFQSNATNLQYIFNPYGTYDVTLFAENDIGCVDSIALSINIRPEHFIYVPNTFTPDGDRFNDYFSVSTVNIVTFQISILNRWGELVFVSNNKNFKWFGTYNGDVVGDSIYNYRILYTTIDGEEGEIYGHVNVLK